MWKASVPQIVIVTSLWNLDPPSGAKAKPPAAESPIRSRTELAFAHIALANWE